MSCINGSATIAALDLQDGKKESAAVRTESASMAASVSQVSEPWYGGKTSITMYIMYESRLFGLSA